MFSHPLFKFDLLDSDEDRCPRCRSDNLEWGFCTDCNLTFFDCCEVLRIPASYPLDARIISYPAIAVNKEGQPYLMDGDEYDPWEYRCLCLDMDKREELKVREYANSIQKHKTSWRKTCNLCGGCSCGQCSESKGCHFCPQNSPSCEHCHCMDTKVGIEAIMEMVPLGEDLRGIVRSFLNPGKEIFKNLS